MLGNLIQELLATAAMGDRMTEPSSEADKPRKAGALSRGCRAFVCCVRHACLQHGLPEACTHVPRPLKRRARLPYLAGGARHDCRPRILQARRHRGSAGRWATRLGCLVCIGTGHVTCI